MPAITPSTLTKAISRSSAPNAAARATVSALSTQQHQQSRTNASFTSPFTPKESAQPSTLKIPSFKKYASKKSEVSNKTFSYFMAGATGLITAAGAKATVNGMQRIYLKKQKKEKGVSWDEELSADYILLLIYRLPCQHVCVRRCPCAG